MFGSLIKYLTSRFIYKCILEINACKLIVLLKIVDFLFLSQGTRDVQFPCDTSFGRSPTPPTSVHKLRPGDIEIVAAIGDSIIAGMGIAATNVPQIIVENKGIAFATGNSKLSLPSPSC